MFFVSCSLHLLYSYLFDVMKYLIAPNQVFLIVLIREFIKLNEVLKKGGGIDKDLLNY